MPDKNRGLVFVIMMLVMTAHVLMKVLACSLMLRINQVWFWIYMLGDMGIYFLYKLVRGDFRYWLLLEGIMCWFATVIVRIIVKVIADFTLLIQFRHQMDVGGAYFSANVAINQAFCFISFYLYWRYSGASEKMVETVWLLVISLWIFSLLNIGLFLIFMNKEYRLTFFDTRTGKQFAVENFRAVESDAMKFEIFGHHPSYYESINEELMKWLNNNWSTWQESSPEWFTADAISNVPAEMLPVSVLASMGGLKGTRKSIDAIKAEESEGRKSVRGADLKIIPDVVVVEEEVSALGVDG